jgi:thiol-disulfide isomerase/thioredoxin
MSFSFIFANKLIKMKKTILLTSLIIAAFAFINFQKENFSKEALASELIDYNGSTVTFQSILDKHKGKTIIIEVWASWCGDCVKAMPQLKKMQSENPTVASIFISLDKTTEKWKKGLEKHQLVGDHYFTSDGMKGKFGTAIDLDWIPRYIIIDKTGKVALYKAIEKDFDKMSILLKEIN